MLRWLVVLFIIVPMLELYLLTLIARATSFSVAIAITLGTGLLGGILAKREGIKVWRRWQTALSRFEVPEEGVVSGLLVLVGGVLLLTPGVLTDIAGVLLLLPPTRRRIANYLRKQIDQRLEVAARVGAAGGLPFQAEAHPGAGHRASGRTIETSGTPLDS